MAAFKWRQSRAASLQVNMLAEYTPGIDLIPDSY
jgi:hypothetical protein